ADEQRYVANEGGDDQQSQQRQRLRPRVQPLQQSTLRCDVLAEHRLPHHVGGSLDHLLDEAALTATADAAARAERHLALREPRRRGRRHPGRLAGAPHAVSVPTSSGALLIFPRALPRSTNRVTPMTARTARQMAARPTAADTR